MQDFMLMVHWFWSVGPKPVGWKSRNCKAKIFRQKAENRKAENTIRSKMYGPKLTFYYFSVIALYKQQVLNRG